MPRIGDEEATLHCDPSSIESCAPGDVLALLSPLQELQPGLYLLESMHEGWAVLRLVVDDEQAERLVLTARESALPKELLALFMPIGLRISSTPH